MGAVQQCPECGGAVDALATACPECGYNFATKTVMEPRPAPSVATAQHDYSGIKGKARRDSSTVGYGIVMGILVIASLLFLLLGFTQAESAITQTAYFAAAAVCGILARIAQASVHHIKLMNELQRR